MCNVSFKTENKLILILIFFLYFSSKMFFVVARSFHARRCLSSTKLVSERLFSSSTVARTCFVSEHLVNRAAVRVAGSESKPFLQGLITNDISILDNETEEVRLYVFKIDFQFETFITNLYCMIFVATFFQSNILRTVLRSMFSSFNVFRM